MKILAGSLLLLFAFSFCNAQNQGSITSKGVKPKADIANFYVYSPPDHLVIPDKIEVSVVYQSGKQFYLKTFPVIKDRNRYVFSFKAPDSTAVLIFSVVDANKKTVDNNNEQGYIFYLYDREGKRFIFENIMLARLLNGYAQYFLKLKETTKTLLVKMYEGAYKLHPELRQNSYYLDYLTVLYKAKENAVKPKLLAYAKQMALLQNNEASWTNAIKIYQLLKMDKEQQEVEQKAIAIYPNGEVAKDKFWNKFYSVKVPTEQSIKASMGEYVNRFKDSSNNVMDNFYMSIISVFLNKKEWDSLKKYESLMQDKLIIAGLYNNFAWSVCEEGLKASESTLNFAKSISKSALNLVQEKINHQGNDHDISGLLLSYDGYADTYALILYKQKQYDSAFYYQDKILQRGQMGVDGKERYAFYAEKVKDALFVKQFIETQLLAGINSIVMLKQLKGIYKQMNLPEDEYAKLKEKSDSITNKNITEIIRLKFGTQVAKNFTLRNLKGELISLSSFKNKIIVLDFWATWCAPCRASFPGMQETIIQYKDDKDVVFLFIDTWERKEVKKMQQNAAQFIKENNYSFLVLLDEKDKVVEDYKVDGIPSKFIINKKGNIVFMGNSSNLALEIENAKD